MQEFRETECEYGLVQNAEDVDIAMEIYVEDCVESNSESKMVKVMAIVVMVMVKVVAAVVKKIKKRILQLKILLADHVDAILVQVKQPALKCLRMR